MEAQSDVCFEVSWEVANKVGGIYTVISSKAAQMQRFNKKYLLVGPWIEDRSRFEVEEERPPAELEAVFSDLTREGIECHYGTWQIESKPKVILVDTSQLRGEANNWKRFWWERFQIDSIQSNWDFEEPMIWSTAVGRLIERYLASAQRKRVVVHAHEWMAGFSLLWLKNQQLPVAKVFTTHATILGRSLAGQGRDLYRELEQIVPEKEAQQVGIQAKFTTERTCAWQADVFTTVSETTAYEAERVLGKRPEVLTLNGLDSDQFALMEELSVIHQRSKERLHEFYSYHFFPYPGQAFDLEKTLTFFTVGRYEFRNKGLDILIQSLSRLNHSLQQETSDQTVVAMIWVPAGIGRMRTDVLESKNYYGHIKSYTRWNEEKILRRLINHVISEKELKSEEIFAQDYLTAVKQDVWKFKREGNPPLCTHHLNDEVGDEVLRELRAHGLENKPEDRVKVVFYPVYLDGHDGLLNLPYYDAMAAGDLGVFASYYEPWGYTPIEAAAMAVPAVTTDLAGCGIYLDQRMDHHARAGVKVLQRRGKSDQEVVADLEQYFKETVNLNRYERSERRMAAKRAVALTDWKELIVHYVDAHNRALEKVAKG